MNMHPPWRTDAEMAWPALHEAASTDVCVIGGGISGLTSAYLLACAGKQVILLDDGPLGGGETGLTTAHLSTALDDRYHRLERWHGAEGARLAAASHAAAIDQIEDIVCAEHIACEFRRVDGYLFGASADQARELECELRAAYRAGIESVQWITSTPLPFPAGPAVRFPRQAQFEPVQYLAGLSKALLMQGGQIYTDSHVTGIQSDDSWVRVTVANGASVQATATIVATHTPIHLRFAVHAKQAAYRSYVLGLSVPRGYLPRALFWDNDHPYHYMRLVERPRDERDLLLVGGADHHTGVEPPQPAFAELETWARSRFTRAGAIQYAWTGQILEPVDGLAYIGRSPAETNVYLITGDSGNGLTHGTLGAMLLRDLICGRTNPWEKLYDPARKSLLAAAEFARENLHAARQYADLVTPGEVEHLEDVPAGDGAILRRGLHKYACYRDPSGACHVCSAICPHLGGVVRWNAVEKSWDCPCHGSRFDCFGKVLNGPANADLSAALIEDEEAMTLAEAHANA